eukprot:COSAG02_NODE_10940_length_1828_cov_1.215732_1_plen_81_part_00
MSRAPTLRTGSSALKFNAGSTKKPWIGIKYKRSVNNTMQDFAMVCPMTIPEDTGFVPPYKQTWPASSRTIRSIRPPVLLH